MGVYMKCVIIANGDLEYSESIIEIIKTAQVIICADGGARHLQALNILPHVLIGDFDSIKKKDYAFFLQEQIKIISLPVKKDYTDTQICISHALEYYQASDITLIGVTGTRMDHTLANIFLLKQLATRNISARIINSHNEIYLVTNYLKLKGNPKQYLSIIPVSPMVSGVTLTGCEYSLNNATIKMGDTIGISNVFKESKVSVSVKTGILIVTKSSDTGRV